MKFKIRLILVLFFCKLNSLNICGQEIHTINISEDSITTDEKFKRLFKDYSKYSEPPMENNEPHVLNTKIKIKGMFDISEHRSSFNVRFYFTMIWKDTRVKYVPQGGNSKKKKWLALPVELMKDTGDTNSYYE